MDPFTTFFTLHLPFADWWQCEVTLAIEESPVSLTIWTSGYLTPAYGTTAAEWFVEKYGYMTM